MVRAVKECLQIVRVKLTDPLSRIDTVILMVGVTRFWSIVAIHPVDRASKGTTALDVRCFMKIKKEKGIASLHADNHR